MPVLPDNVIWLADHRAVAKALDAAEGMLRKVVAEDKQDLLPFVICCKADGERIIVRYVPGAAPQSRRSQALDIGRKMRVLGVTEYAVCNLRCIPGNGTRQGEVLSVEAHTTEGSSFRLYEVRRRGSIRSLGRVTRDHAAMVPDGTWKGLLSHDD